MLTGSLLPFRAQSTWSIAGFASHGLTCFAITSYLPVQPVEVLFIYPKVSIALLFSLSRADYDAASAAK